MILGVGVDIVGVPRLRKAVERIGERFLHRVFTEGELAYCMRQADPYPSLAARFAAKEAVVKALSALGRITITQVEILNDGLGKPGVNTAGRVGELLGVMPGREGGRLHLSLSHERDTAVAFVIAESSGE